MEAALLLPFTHQSMRRMDLSGSPTIRAMRLPMWRVTELSCGEEVEAAWVKCPVCKAALKEDPGEPGPPEPVKETSPKLCPKCGEEVEDFWDTCLFCKTSLTDGGGPDG